MRIYITGIAGVLGSALAEFFYEQGYDVYGNDIVRPEDAWRLREAGILDKIKYRWKSTTDLTENELLFKDIIIDAGLMVPDRDFGIFSPEFTTINNILPPLHLLEIISKMDFKPIVIYPSSFNALYGWGYTQLEDNMPPKPSTLYGWTKGAVEQLYMTYYISFKVPVIITRVGSAYGPRMRKSELIGKIISYILEGKDKFYLKSPNATRLWTYSEDVIRFYDTLINHTDIYRYIGKVLHCAGNKYTEIIPNNELAMRIKKIANSDMQIIEEEYEPGEVVDKMPVRFMIKESEFPWKPIYSLDEGIEETFKWFEQHYQRWGW